jgi:hypothetical protein
MNGKILETVVVVLVVGAAAVFAAVRAVRAVRGKRPSCCGDGESPSRTPKSCSGCCG